MKEKIFLFFKNKFLIILVLFALLLSVIGSSCFAVDLTYNDTTYTVSDYGDLVVGDYYCLFLSFNETYPTQHAGGNVFLVIGRYYDSITIQYPFTNDSIVFVKNDILYYYDFSTSSWVLYHSRWDADGFSHPFRFGCCFYTNFDILGRTASSSGYELLNDTVVFPKAPPTVELTQVTIPAIQEVGEIPQAMKEVLKILIPIGLVIFGIGLVIYLIRYLISRVV